MYRTTMKWLQESRLPHMADVAREAGVDMTGWRIGRLFGSSIVLVDDEMNRYGQWDTLKAAEQGTDAMINAWRAVITVRKGN